MSATIREQMWAYTVISLKLLSREVHQLKLAVRSEIAVVSIETTSKALDHAVHLLLSQAWLCGSQDQ